MHQIKVTHITVTQAAQALGVSRQRIYQLIELGKLDAIDSKGNVRLVSVESINARLAEQGACDD